MATSDVLREQLAEVEAELAGLDDRRVALEQAAADLRTAVASVEALGNGSAPATSRRRRPARPKRPSVSPQDLVGALQELGGTATVDQLVEQLQLPDGRSLNGARRIAVDAGTVAYEDRTYSLVGEASSSGSDS